MKKRKILFIIPRIVMGGAEQQLLYLLRCIDKEKFKIYLGLLYKDSEQINEWHKIKNIKIINFEKKNQYDLSIYFKIAKFLKEENIDIIQTFLGNHHGYIPALLARKTIAIGGKRNTTLAKMHSSKFYELNEFIIPRILTKITKFILVSNCYSGKEIYLKKGFPSGSVSVIPNGIDYDRFSKGDKNKIIKEFDLKNKFIIGMVSRLVEGKNHENLIRNFKRLTKDYDNLVLLLIGDGLLRGQLEKLARESSLAEKIIFTGNREDIPDFLAAIDIFVFPSMFPEGWPNAIGEAMAAGLPVVAYKIGDVEYIIKNNYDGLITKQYMDSFMNKIIELINDKKKREYLGRNAMATIFKNYQREKMVGNYEQLYIDRTSSLM